MKHSLEYYIRRCAEILYPECTIKRPREFTFVLCQHGCETLQDVSFSTDLNAQARVFRKLCQMSVKTKKLVQDIIWHYLVNADTCDDSLICADQACLTAEENFPLLCEVIDRMDEVPNA